MKILIATPYFWPQPGGLERYAYELATRLVARGHEVQVVTSGSQASTEVIDGITVRHLRTSFTVSNTPLGFRWLWGMRRIIREFQPDVINAHAPVPSMMLAAWLVAGRTPFVTTYHAGSMKKGRRQIDRIIGLYERIVLPLVLSRSQAIIAASTFVSHEFLSRWTRKSTIITPGVDTSLFVPTQTKRATGRVVFVGDFRDPRKGLSYLLEAMSGLSQAHLRVIGTGEPVVRPRVTYLGALHGKMLVRELQLAEVLVLPSTTDSESFGMVLIEAMACGVPVIGTTAGGMKDVITVGQTGLLVPPADAPALTEALARLLANPAQLRQMGATGRDVAIAIYDWDARAELTEAVLMQAIEKAKPTQIEAFHG